MRRWRRDLYPAEKRVDFVQLEERFDTIEKDLVDAMAEPLNKMFDRMLEEVKRILENEDYPALKKLKLGYRDKLISVVKSYMFEAFKVGKAGVQAEFSVDKEVTISKEARDYLSVKADNVVTNILDKIKSQVVFIVLAGMREHKSIDEVLAEIKGPAYGEVPVQA